MGNTRIISLLNQKGGVGKTTTTVNLASALAAHGKKVLVVDLDPQTHLGLHFGIENATTSVYDLLIDESITVNEAKIPARTRIDLVTSEVDLAAAESVETETDQAPADGNVQLQQVLMSDLLRSRVPANL